MDAIKEEVIQYWSQRAEQFSSLRLAELNSEKRQLWMRELLRCLPERVPLRILDVGTGSGFFAFLLSAIGHHVTGIDLTASMINAAKEAANALSLQAEFLVMDAEQPDFPDETFDVVISRNLTWTLPHLETAYRQWRRVLKPGGILVNFDGDYCHEQSMEQQVLPENHAHKAISPALVSAYERLKSELAAGQQPRPTWDAVLLQRAGFQNIQIDTGLSQRLYQTIDAFYNPTPMFIIRAVRE